MAGSWSKKETLYDRFIKYVKKTDGCWLWTGPICHYGYGKLGFKMKSYKAHRVSYQLFNGYIDEKLGCLHKCHNRSCVNPEHLYLGDQKDNMRDCIEAGRNNFGERNGASKLKDRQVVDIKKLLETKEYFDREIAEMFNVSRSAINAIKLNKRRYREA